jgi:4-cresol dehydrogenase (hydroxylating)
MTPFDERLKSAMEAWQNVLGRDRVQDTTAATARYGPCTTNVKRQILAALCPTSQPEIIEIVKIAEQLQIPLYPISTGHNWGYGTANPARDGCVIVDLSGMTQILDFDPCTGLVVLEPGVTQQDLSNFLIRGGYSFMVPTTGAGPSCSVLANALERGYGITPYADHFGAVMCLEAVLPDGRVYRSALTELGGTQVDHAFKWGLGPYVDGLFAQGSFGIVTRMTLVLARRPAGFTSFYIQVRRNEGLESVVKATQATLSALPGIVGSINIMNSLRTLAMTSSYPRHEAGSDGCLPLATLARLEKENHLSPWTGIGALYGEPGVVDAAKKVVKQLLGSGECSLLFITPRRVRIARGLISYFPESLGSRFLRKIKALEGSLDLMLGKPSEVAMTLAYWKRGIPDAAKRPLDPARDGCGLIWYPPLVPMKEKRVREYVSGVETICRAHGIEPLITLTALSDRCFDSSVPLLFDRDDPKQVAQADACYQALFDFGRQKGFVPYRLGPNAMSAITSTNVPYWDMVRQIKRTLDPQDIMAPGRYSGHAE